MNFHLVEEELCVLNQKNHLKQLIIHLTTISKNLTIKLSFYQNIFLTFSGLVRVSIVKWPALEFLCLLGSSGHAWPETRLLYSLPDVYVSELKDQHIQRCKPVAFG